MVNFQNTRSFRRLSHLRLPETKSSSFISLHVSSWSQTVPYGRHLVPRISRTVFKYFYSWLGYWRYQYISIETRSLALTLRLTSNPRVFFFHHRFWRTYDALQVWSVLQQLSSTSPVTTHRRCSSRRVGSFIRWRTLDVECLTRGLTSIQNQVESISHSKSMSITNGITTVEWVFSRQQTLRNCQRNEIV